MLIREPPSYWVTPSPLHPKNSNGGNSLKNIAVFVHRNCMITSIKIGLNLERVRKTPPSLFYNSYIEDGIENFIRHICYSPGSTDKEMREMVGEVVPPLLAEEITEHITKLHQGRKKDVYHLFLLIDDILRTKTNSL